VDALQRPADLGATKVAGNPAHGRSFIFTVGDGRVPGILQMIPQLGQQLLPGLLAQPQLFVNGGQQLVNRGFRFLWAHTRLIISCSFCMNISHSLDCSCSRSRPAAVMV
jgi:hypothetical protein